MNRIALLLIFLLFGYWVQAQDKPVTQPVNTNVPKNLDPRFQDSLGTGNLTQRSTSNKNIKNLDARIEMYKIISKELDTIIVDTTLSIQKEYNFNYLRKDAFDLIPFLNLGQTYNSLSVDFNDPRLMPRFGARARHFNYMEVEDMNYYYVPTPFTELMFKSAFEQGQLLDAFFTVNTSKRFNFSVAYKGLRSLGKYQHQLTSTGNFRATTNFRSKNGRYEARAHIVAQDLLNQENGGIRDEDIINFESGNPEYIDRSVFDPVFEDAESILEGKRFHLEHSYKVVDRKDSLTYNRVKLGNVLSFTDKYYEFTQGSANSVFGEAFESDIQEKTTLEDFYGELSATFENKTIGSISGRVGYNNFNYGYDKLVQVNGETIINRLKGDVISAGGSYSKQIRKLSIDADLGIMVSGDLDGNYFRGSVSYIKDEDLKVKAGINLNSRAPNYNYLLYQSDYLNYNWQNDFENVQTRQLAFEFNSKWVDAQLDYNTIDNYAYFTENEEGFVRPVQTPKSINYFRVLLSREFHFGKFHLMNTLRYQTVLDGEGVLNVPELITRNTFYYANSFFKNNALFLQTGITFKYFTSYNMNAYDPVLAEFYVQNETELGGFPLLDFFINVKVRQTRIYLKAEHFNSSFTGYNFYSAPNYPYRDFIVRFGLVWNFFL